MRVDTLTYLTLVITYQCSSRCAHCCLGAGPENDEWMTVDQAEHYIADATADSVVDTMTLIGGEALLDVDQTIAIGTAALRHGIRYVQIDTNGSWATDAETAENVLRRVFDAGLHIIAISVDAFHQAYVPPERALCAMQAARSLGIKLEGSSEILEAEDAANTYDAETHRLTEWFAAWGFSVSPGSPPGVVFQGRGASLAGLYAGPKCIPTERCSGVPWFATPDFRRLGGIEIDPYGWVHVEHGLCIGNAKERPLREVLGAYDPHSHPVICVLMDEGPIGLTRTPEAEGFDLRPEGYVDKCHLCHEIRTHLRPGFPGLLEPAQCYPEITEAAATRKDTR